METCQDITVHQHCTMLNLQYSQMFLCTGLYSMHYIISYSSRNTHGNFLPSKQSQLLQFCLCLLFYDAEEAYTHTFIHFAGYRLSAQREKWKHCGGEYCMMFLKNSSGASLRITACTYGLCSHLSQRQTDKMSRKHTHMGESDSPFLSSLPTALLQSIIIDDLY